MSEYDMASNQCPSCRHTFRTLADEFGTHACPRCGHEEVPFEPDSEPWCPECDAPCDECECEEEEVCRN